MSPLYYRDSNDAQQRTENHESQLFQSKISTSNPFNLFYLYRSLDKKSHTASQNTGTTTTPPVTNQASMSSQSGGKKLSNNHSNVGADGRGAGSSHHGHDTKGTSVHICSLCDVIRCLCFIDRHSVIVFIT